MPSLVAKEVPRRKKAESTPGHERTQSKEEPIQSPPPSPPGDVQARIAGRAYELYAERGYRDGCALDDWLQAEHEILGLVRKA